MTPSTHFALALMGWALPLAACAFVMARLNREAHGFQRMVRAKLSASFKRGW